MREEWRSAMRNRGFPAAGLFRESNGSGLFPRVPNHSADLLPKSVPSTSTKRPHKEGDRPKDHAGDQHEPQRMHHEAENTKDGKDQQKQKKRKHQVHLPVLS